MRPEMNLTEFLLEIAVAFREVATKVEYAATSVALMSTPHTTSEGNTTLEIDHEALMVRWNGDSCFLGYTTAFRLIERLARRPNQYFSHKQLLEDVWGGFRSKSAIRSAIKDLRDRLESAGMTDLANRIDGSNSGHYGLIIDRRR